MAEEFTGRVNVTDEAGRKVFRFNAERAVLDLGAAGNPGDLRLFADDGGAKLSFNGVNQTARINDAVDTTVFWFNANLAMLDIGPSRTDATGPHDGRIRVFDAHGAVKIDLDGHTGDIRLAGADCAEDFDTIEAAEAEPGSVMTIGDGGRLLPCTEAYDRRVAGVVSGAGAWRPGIVLDSRPSHGQRARIALTGKAYCRIDADHGSVGVGDLLTTSSTPGHAMRVGDASRAVGAILGKALRPLGSGTRLIPILVALQ
jgi:hypothetical protein